MTSFVLIWLFGFTAFLLGIFLWVGLVALFGFLCISYSYTDFVKRLELNDRVRVYKIGFYLFLLGEGLIFATLLVLCSWFGDGVSWPVASWCGVSATGCLLLITSSVFISLFMGCCAPGARYSIVCLSCSVFLGVCFVLIQCLEVWSCETDLMASPYYAISLCIIGLHCIHVILGLVGLVEIYRHFGFFHVEVVKCIVIYWHFVDIIWIFVYAVVYFL